MIQIASGVNLITYKYGILLDKHRYVCILRHDKNKLNYNAKQRYTNNQKPFVSCRKGLQINTNNRAKDQKILPLEGLKKNDKMFKSQNFFNES